MSATVTDVLVVEQGLLSAYGSGVACCADGLLSGRVAFRPAGDENFSPALAALPVGRVPGVLSETGAASDARLLTWASRLVSALERPVPADAWLYVATTVGEISRLEAEVTAGAAATGASRIPLFAARVAAAAGLSGGAVQVVSSACASSTAALALAASAIRRGEATCAVVVGADLVSEFVLSGFAALMAVDPEGARPFDADRRGVTLGEAVAVAVLMSRERAEREQRKCLGVIGGWGMTCDANHLTGPSRDGAPLARAVCDALAMAGCEPDKVAALCAHGTGTVYNDQMEMLAFRRVFGDRALPVFSVKGGMGHVLGAAGLAEALLSLEFLRRGALPPTVGMRRAADEARGWVTAAPTPVSPADVMVTTNSGFGGVNAALVLSLGPFRQAALREADAFSACVAGEGLFSAGDAVPAGGAFAAPRNFGRFSAAVKMAFHALAQALEKAGLRPDAEGFLHARETGVRVRVGVVACDGDGSETANRAYYADYVTSGRVLGRGQLFVYTLPTSVAAECAIACRLTGPLLYVAEPGGGEGCAMRAAQGWLADGSADAVVVLRVTAEAARASVVVPALPGEA